MNTLQPATFRPAYRSLLDIGELQRRVESAYRHMEDCDLCARYCRVNRRQTLEGVACRTGERAVVNSYGAHHGEEDPLRGWAGSGTIFFSWCNLRCVFCQNWDISQRGIGREVEPAELADMMLELQSQGCHNINLVSPSHVVAQILAAVLIAAHGGLHLPLVYNTGGYDSPEALALLDGVIDIYMPDMKYADSATAHRYSHVRGYWEVNQAAVREMHRQVGDLMLDPRGIAQRGLLVRHPAGDRAARAAGAPSGAARRPGEHRRRACLYRRPDLVRHLRQPHAAVLPVLPRLRLSAARPPHHRRGIRTRAGFGGEARPDSAGPATVTGKVDD